MAKITRKRTIEENILGEFNSQGREALTIMTANTVALQNFHTETLKAVKAFNGSAKAQRELLELDRRSEKLIQEKIKSDQQIQKLEEAAAKAKRAQLAVDRDLVRERERANKQREKEAKAIKESSSEYMKQSKRLNDLRKSYKDLILEQGKETRQTLLLKKEIVALDGALKKVDASVGQNQRSVGNYEKAVGGLKNMLGQLGITLGVFAVLKDVLNVVKSNEDAMASLSAITGLTGEKFEVFKDAINETAIRLKVSSTEVASAAEKIASAQPKLLDNADALAAVTEQAIILNKAIKGDLTETSLALVGVMNQFGLEASEASRIINVLAAGSQAGAADVNQLNESMTKSGAVAKIQGLEVEELTGAIETLGEKAIFGADAGTALRNILLKMASIDVLPEKAAKQLEKYGVNTDIVKNKSLSFEERLRELSKVATDSTAIMQIFGTENATAATVLLNNLDTYGKMTAAVTGTNVANEQAAINANTLTNAFKEFRATLDNIIIKWSESTDGATALKDVIKFLTNNLETVLKTLLHGITVWASYRLAMSLVNKEGTGLLNVLWNMAKSFANVAEGAQKVRVSFASWVGLAVALVPILWDLAKSTYEMYANTSALDKATEKYNVKIDEERAKMDLLRVQIMGAVGDKNEMKKIIDQINADYGTTLSNIEDETGLMDQLWKAYQKVNDEMERRIMSQILEEDLLNAFKAKREFERLQSDLGERTLFNAPSWDLFQLGIDKSTEAIKELQSEMFRLGNNPGQGKEFGNLDKLNLTNDPEAAEESANDIVDIEKKKLDRLSELRKKNADELVLFENEAIKAGYDRQTIDELLVMRRRELLEDELIFIQELQLKTREEYNKTYNERIKLLDSEVTKLESAKIEKIKIAEEEAGIWEIVARIGAEQAEKNKKRLEDATKQLRDTIVNASKMLEDFAERAIQAIDRQIEKIDEQLDASKTREDQLREEAQKRGLDADEAITVERERQKALIAQQQELERKKMEIEALLIMLRAFAAQVEQGQGNPVANIKSSITEMINFSKNLPGFIDGTNTTVEKSLGKPNLQNVGPDNYAIRVNGKERILNPELSAMIPENVPNLELVRSYLYNKAGQKIQDSYENNISTTSDSNDSILYDALMEQNELLKKLPSKMPSTSGSFETISGYIRWKQYQDRKTTITHAPVRQRF